MEFSGEKRHAREFFAAANGGEGFISYYGEIFSPERLERRYLIKGGAGSGKSSLMRRVASMAEDRGIEVERYLCSSDHTSLDGVIIGGRVALIDATSPHALECECAGALDGIVDTGRFWNEERLGRSRGRIEELNEIKKRRYSGAYRYLGAAMSVGRAQREALIPYVNTEKIARTAARLLSSVPDGEGYSRKIGLCSSIGMKGKHRLDCYERSAERLYVIEDVYSTADLLLAALLGEAERKRTRVRVSYSPLDKSRPDALLLEESGVGFVIGRAEKGERRGRVNMRRFVNLPQAETTRVRSEFKAAERLKNGLIALACDELASAAKAHFALEEIYGEAMDFASLGKYCEDLGEKITKRFILL